MTPDFEAALSHDSTLSKSQKVLALVRKFPFRTSRELAAAVDSGILDVEIIHKRLPDLRKKGLLVNSDTRACRVTGKEAQTWAPVDAEEGWPLTMAEAQHIALTPCWVGTDENLAEEYGVEVKLVTTIRQSKSYKGVRLDG